MLEVEIAKISAEINDATVTSARNNEGLGINERFGSPYQNRNPAWSQESKCWIFSGYAQL